MDDSSDGAGSASSPSSVSGRNEQRRLARAAVLERGRQSAQRRRDTAAADKAAAAASREASLNRAVDRVTRVVGVALVCLVAGGLARSAREMATVDASDRASSAAASHVKATAFYSQTGVAVNADGVRAAAAASAPTVSASASSASTPSAYTDSFKAASDSLYTAARTVAYGVPYAPDASTPLPLALDDINTQYDLRRAQHPLTVPAPLSRPAPLPPPSTQMAAKRK